MKPLVLILALSALVLVVIPIVVMEKMSSDAHAERMQSDPAYRQRTLIDNAIEALAEQSSGHRTDRVSFLVDDIAKTYGISRESVLSMVLQSMVELRKAGVSEDSVQLLEAMRMAFHPAAAGDSGFAVKLASYVLMRQQGASAEDVHRIVAPGR